jgi:hypothetical protein
MTGDSDDVELRHKSGEIELQASTAQQSQSTTVTVSGIFEDFLVSI